MPPHLLFQEIPIPSIPIGGTTAEWLEFIAVLAIVWYLDRRRGRQIQNLPPIEPRDADVEERP